MGLTTAMYTALTGINVNQARIDTIGNNIANVNTTAFKGSRTLFQNQFYQTWSMGNPPSESSGGVNPTQVGLGALVASTQRSMTPGSVETTGVPGDLAIEGNGFFIVRRPGGQTVYTRDGSFSLDAGNRLVTRDGHAVQGFGVDEGFAIVPGVLTDLTIPLGTQSLARQTSLARLDGDLSADGTIATQGSTSVTQGLVDAAGNAATAATALTDLRSAGGPLAPLFATGTTITVRGVTKGQRELPTQQFVVGTTGNTLGDLAGWLEDMLGIQTGAGLPGSPGVAVENGTLVVRSNAGEENAIAISSDDITSDNPGSAVPFTFTQTQQANGSGVFTAFTVYDSLGSPVLVNLTFALESTPDTGPVWRFYAESPDASGGPRALGTGTVEFDTAGNFRRASGNQITIPRSNTGAATPIALDLDFSGLNGLSTQNSQVILADQDGHPAGSLVSYAIGRDGIITGVWSNGLTRTLGQLALASFPNPEGLVATTDNAYEQGPNSGAPTVTTPGLAGTGGILSGALELSNVDLAREFIGLITSSAGFQASTRVISVSSDLLDQLLLAVR